MARHQGLDRRSFLRNAGTTALLGAVGARGAAAAELGLVDATEAGLGSTTALQEFNFDEIVSRVGTNTVKWDRPIETYGEVIKVGMGVADMDFRVAPCITNALAERCKHEVWGYEHRPASYAQSVADWNQRRYGLEIDPESLIFTTGVHPALIYALQTFAPPGSRVLLLTPTYSGFYSDLTYTRTIAEESPLILENGKYRIDFDDFERRAQRSNAFILCNPQNPTGNVWSEADLLRLGEICLEHKVPVLSDEIHCDFVTKGNTYTPFAALPNKEVVDNSLSFKSSSKTFSMAAMKIAWFFSTDADLLARVRTYSRADLPTLGMIANQAALDEGEPWLDQLLPYLDANHDFVEATVREQLPMVSYTKAEGTFLAWLDVSELVDAIGAKKTAWDETASSVTPVAPEDIVQRFFANEAGVFLNPGDGYGAGGEGHMRMNLAAPRKVIDLALSNMEDALRAI